MKTPYGNLPKPFLALAPLDEVSDTVFRQIIADCARPDLFFTEFTNVDALQSAGRESALKRLRHQESERPLIAQIWGKDPENFYKTAQQLVDGSLAREANMPRETDFEGVQGSNEKRTNRINDTESESRKRLTQQSSKSRNSLASLSRKQDSAICFSGVDLNMGCPAKSEVKAGTCSALIKNRPLAEQIIKATKKGLNGELPLSVKTRVGFSEVDMSWIEFLLGQGLDMLIIHGRTRKEMSKVPANWDLVGEASKLRDQIAPNTLIVGNGDVETRQQAEELANQYGIDGVMIGRGIFHDPFVFAHNSPWQDYTKRQKIELYKRHVELFLKTWTKGERKLYTLNKFCKVYVSGFDGAKEMRDKLMHAETGEELLGLLDGYNA